MSCFAESSQGAKNYFNGLQARKDFSLAVTRNSPTASWHGGETMIIAQDVLLLYPIPVPVLSHTALPNPSIQFEHSFYSMVKQNTAIKTGKYSTQQNSQNTFLIMLKDFGAWSAKHHTGETKGRSLKHLLSSH